MKIVIIGCGKIGVTLIESFLKEGHEVTAVDSDSSVITDIANSYDVRTICGNGTDYELLAEAGISSTDLIVATTDSDELNMLSCFIARKMGAKHTVARIRNTEYNTSNLSFIKHQLELSMVINPELLAAELIYNILKLPTAINVETFARRKLEMAELIVKQGSALDGAKLIDLRKSSETQFLISVVERDGELFIPGGNFVLQSGDKIGIVASQVNLYKTLKALGLLQKQAKNVMILGAGKTSYYLSQMLLKSDNSVKIIEIDEKRCEELCETLPNNAVIVHGDGMNHELLEEEGFSDTDALVALTGMDEENILISFYAMSKGIPKVISKVNREVLSSIAEKLGLDCLISPRNITADILLRYARGLNNSIGSKMETLYSLMDGKAEALEFNVLSDFEHINVPIKDMKIKKDILIAGIIRNQNTFIPSGSDAIMPGDNIIVIAKGRHLYDLSEIIEE